MEPVKKGTQVLDKPIMAGTRTVEFETSFELRLDIGRQILQHIEGVSICQRTSRYSLAAEVGGLFDINQVRGAILAYLTKQAPSTHKEEPCKQVFRPSYLSGLKVAFGVVDDIVPSYTDSIKRFSHRLAGLYVESPHLYPFGKSCFPPDSWPFRYVGGIDPIGIGMDFNLKEDTVGIMRVTDGYSPLIEHLHGGPIKAEVNLSQGTKKEFIKMWQEQVAGIRPAVPAVEWKELCVVNGFIIQTTAAYPHKFRIILAPDTDFLAPTSRRYYLGRLAHLINGDKLMPPDVRIAVVGLTDYCVTVYLNPPATTSNISMVGYLVKKINDVGSPYSSIYKDSVGGDDTLMALSLAMGWKAKFPLPPPRPAKDTVEPSADQQKRIDEANGPQPSDFTADPKLGMNGDTSSVENKKLPRKLTSVASRKNARVLIGVSEEHRLVVLVDKASIPSSVGEKFICCLSAQRVYHNNFSLLEGQSVAHTHMLAMRLMELYRKAPGIGRSAPYWTAKEPHEQATNPDLKDALRDVLMGKDGAKVAFEAIYQFDGPAPAPTPLPAPRYVTVRHVCQIGHNQHRFELQVMGGPKFSISTVERAMLSYVGQKYYIGKAGQFCIQQVHSADTSKIDLTVVTVGAFNIKSETVAKDLVDHLKKYGPKSDQNDKYNLVTPV